MIPSWPVMQDPMVEGPCEDSSVDVFDDNSIALFGQNFGSYYLSSPRGNSKCSLALIDNNSPSGNSKSNESFQTWPSFGLQQPRILHPVPHGTLSQFPNMINQSCMINNNYPADQDSSAPGVSNFVNHNPPQNIQQLQVVMGLNGVNPVHLTPGEIVAAQGLTMNGEPGGGGGGGPPVKGEPEKKRKTRVRPPSQTFEHIMAERRRREQISQLFVALAALVPGLKKMDKSSVLDDAIKYMKHLKERVRDLEAKAETHAMESVILVRKTQITISDEESSDGGQSRAVEEHPLPEVEARSSNNHLLLKVHCEKRKGIVVNLVSKVESMNMIVVNSNATPFGNVALDITIVAEMEKEFNLTMKEVVRAVREAIESRGGA